MEYPARIIGELNIEIGNNFHADARLRLETYEVKGSSFSPKILIGDNVNLNFDCHIGCINRITIGNNVLMGSRVFITDHFHGESTLEYLDIPPATRLLVSKGEVVIEDNVWIGENVSIMPNVTIGKGSIVGANAVVTKSFPAYSIIGGNPARVIKVT